MTYSTTQDLAHRADAARIRAGVTITTFAEILDVSYSTARRRLKGTHAWSSEDIAKAADAFGVTDAHLIRGDEVAA